MGRTILLSPNFTSVTQPMDQGIICVLKAKYRLLVVRTLISVLERKARLPSISILSAITLLPKMWNAIPNKIITICFPKCGVSQEAADSALTDEIGVLKNFEIFSVKHLQSWSIF